MEEIEYKTSRIKKDAWKHLKKKSTDKETTITEELDLLIQNDIKQNKKERHPGE